MKNENLIMYIIHFPQWYSGTLTDQAVALDHHWVNYRFNRPDFIFIFIFLELFKKG